MGTKVLLTGATGFIGSHVARRLLADGCEVHAIVRPGSDQRRIRDIAGALHMLPGDLLAPEELDRCVDGARPDVCIHLAWCTEPGAYLHSRENIRFVEASLRLAIRLAEQGCGRFVGAGTCLEYDTSVGYLSESSPLRPASLYAASKLGLGLMLDQLGQQTGMRVAWLRLLYLYGPGEDERRLVPSVICALLRGQQAQVTEGVQIRDYLHVDDVAAAVWAVAQSELSGPVNIGSGRPVAVRDLVGAIGALSGRREAIAFGAIVHEPRDPMFICADTRRLTGHTSWTPRYDLDSGLQHTIAWWRSHLAGR